MASVNVWLNGDYIKKDGSCAVFVYTYIRRQKVRFNTGVSVKPDNWNDEKKRIKGSSKFAKDNNLVIDNCISRVNDIFVRYRLSNRELTPDILKKEYKTPSTYIDFYDFMRKTIQEEEGMLSKNTIAAHNSLLNKLTSFRKSLMFADITPELIDDFHKFMKNKLKNNPNTIQKTLSNFRAFMNTAKKKKVIDENPFDQVKLKRGQVNRQFLEEHELTKLIELYNRYPANKRYVLKYFLFACFTGLRISDIRRIKYEDVINDTLVFQPYKTRGMTKIVRIPLTRPAKRYMKDNQGLKIRGCIFQPYADQVTNRLLKEIIQDAGIQKDISFHCARHTFATMYLRKTRDLAGLQKLLGHYSITETMKYAHVLDDDIKETIKFFDKY